jgi:hypothetical protein
MSTRKIEHCLKCHDPVDRDDENICQLCGCGFWCGACLGDHEIDCRLEHEVNDG